MLSVSSAATSQTGIIVSNIAITNKPLIHLFFIQISPYEFFVNYIIYSQKHQVPLFVFRSF